MIVNIENPGIISTSNWNRVRHAFNVAWKEIEQGKLDSRKTWDPVMKEFVYSLDRYGCLISTPVEQNTLWKFWNGKWLENLLPWTKPLRAELEKAGIPIYTITYHIHNNNIFPHKDVSYLGDLPNENQTNLNFIISNEAPDETYTWCRDDNGNEMRYYSHPDKLWLLDASNLHAVVCNTLREGLIIKFRQPFEKVKNFIDQHPNFLDANQPYFKS